MKIKREIDNYYLMIYKGEIEPWIGDTETEIEVGLIWPELNNRLTFRSRDFPKGFPKVLIDKMVLFMFQNKLIYMECF